MAAATLGFPHGPDPTKIPDFPTKRPKKIVNEPKPLEMSLTDKPKWNEAWLKLRGYKEKDMKISPEELYEKDPSQMDHLQVVVVRKGDQPALGDGVFAVSATSAGEEKGPCVRVPTRGAMVSVFFSFSLLQFFRILLSSLGNRFCSS